MNGLTNLFLDTNALIALLRNDALVLQMVAASPSVAVSIISVIEFRVGVQADNPEAVRFDEVLRRMAVVSILSTDVSLLDSVVSIRQNFRLKLPDAMIAASALIRGDTLVTRDRQFSRVTGLDLRLF